MDLEDEIDKLYSTPPPEFTPLRNALSAQLKKAGDKTGALRISALTKPSLAAFAVNQLYRTLSKEFAQLLKMGDRLRHAQRQGAPGMRKLLEVQQEQRAIIDELTRSAQHILERANLKTSATTLERIKETLTSISTLNRWGDETSGRLSRELPPPSFDAVLELLRDEQDETRDSAPPEHTQPQKQKQTQAKTPTEVVPDTDLVKRREALEAQRKAAAEARHAAEAKVTKLQQEYERTEAHVKETELTARAAEHAAKLAETEAKRRAEAVKAAETALLSAKRAASTAASHASTAVDHAEQAQSAAERAERSMKAVKAELDAAEARLAAIIQEQSRIPHG